MRVPSDVGSVMVEWELFDGRSGGWIVCDDFAAAEVLAAEVRRERVDVAISATFGTGETVSL